MNKSFEVLDKEYIEKYDYSKEFGLPPEKRDLKEFINRGAVILDKPRKTTCQNLVVHIKRMLNIKKASHVGTLDPNVTGVLPMLFEKSTKINHYLSKSDKEYVALMVLHTPIEEEKIISALKGFEGTIEQLPPKKSAVKRTRRKRRIYKIDILEIDSKRYVLFRVKVEAGTYIRTLCIDVGKKLGVKAHMQELRRTESLNFKEEETVNFYDFHEKAVLCSKFKKCDLLMETLLPIEEVVKRNFPSIYVKDVAASALVYGANLYSKGIVMYDKDVRKDSIVGIYSLNGELIGLGRVIKELNDRGVVVDMLSILASTKHYPKMWKNERYNL